jgi:hypothetical protein
MTDKAVSALTSLTGANTATGDLLYIVDISEPSAADRSKKITAEEIQNYLKKFPATIGVGGATPAASGAGISFPATASASSDANTLDDYEEGTFTPTLAGGFSTAPTSYATQAGAYTKIGRLVYFQLDVDAVGAVADTSHLTISGLPFNSVNASDGFGGANISYQSNFNTNTSDVYHISANTNLIRVYTVSGANRQGSASGIDVNARIILFGLYQV